MCSDSTLALGEKRLAKDLSLNRSGCGHRDAHGLAEHGYATGVTQDTMGRYTLQLMIRFPFAFHRVANAALSQILR